MKGKRAILNTKRYNRLDQNFMEFERKTLTRENANLRLIPNASHRIGTKSTLLETAFSLGVFHSLIAQATGYKTDCNILDLGCGYGFIATAAAFSIGEKGVYVGIDKNKKRLEFCKEHYPNDQFKFHRTTPDDELHYPFDDGFFNAATAVSLFTHLSENVARAVMSEINRTGKPDMKAILTFFVLDDVHAQGRGKAGKWDFENSLDGSEHWKFSTQHSRTPYSNVGVTAAGVESLAKQAGMRLIEIHPGRWKGGVGPFYQDICIFEKA